MRWTGLFCLVALVAGCSDTTEIAPTGDPGADTGVSMDAGADGSAEEVGNNGAGNPGFVEAPRGSYTAGSPLSETGRNDDETQHRVTITRPFWVAVHEVTQDRWAALMGDNPSGYRACGGECPVESVSWFDAVAYTNALSMAEGLTPCYLEPQFSQPYSREDAAAQRVPVWEGGLDCQGYRLPTEAEWEYAARAGSETAFHNGPLEDTECRDPSLDAAGWYCGNSENATHPVGGKLPNAWGLYDVHGNVWEWVWDGFADYPDEDLTDPTGPDSSNLRVQRGGSWSYTAKFCRAATRTGVFAGEANSEVGFRVVRSIQE